MRITLLCKRLLYIFRAKSRVVNDLSGEVDLSRGHEGNKHIGVWIPEKKYQELEDFLNKFSTGDTFATQFREFIFWILNQKEGVSTAAIALRLEEIRKKKEIEELPCVRGVMKLWQWQNTQQREFFCSVCRQRYKKEYESCQEQQRRRKVSES